MGFFRRSRSRKQKEVDAVKHGFGGGGATVQDTVGGGKSLTYPSGPSSQIVAEDESLGETLGTSDQFELELPIKRKVPVGILKNGFKKKVETKQNQETENNMGCLDNLHKPVTSSKIGKAIDAGLSKRDYDHLSVTSSLTLFIAENNSQNAQATQQDLSRTFSQCSARLKEPTEKIRQSYGGCCTCTTTSRESLTTADSNSLVADDPNQSGDDNNSNQWSNNKLTFWTLLMCGETNKDNGPVIMGNSSMNVVSISPVLPRDTSLFDTLQDEIDDSETHAALADPTNYNADVAETVTTSTRKWKTPKLRLPKVRSLRRKLSRISNKSKEKIKQ